MEALVVLALLINFVMVYKIPNSQKGITLLEFLITILLILILAGGIFHFVNPVQARQKARDNKRLADISNLDRIINEYYFDNRIYPDLADTLRSSHILPEGSPSLFSAQSSWIACDFRKYTTKIFTDPLNDEIYHYSYFHDGNTYEINATMEILFDEAQNDGGNNPNVYELGNNLNLILTP